MRWFKLWSEVRNDAKLRVLSAEDRWIWLSLLCLASEQDERGSIRLPSRLVAAETCGGDVEKLVTTCNEFVTLRLIEVTTLDEKTVDISFPSFAERQSKSPSDDPDKVRERVQRHRSKGVAKSKKVTSCNGRETSGNDIQKQKQNTETEKNPPPTPPFRGDVRVCVETVETRDLEPFASPPEPEPPGAVIPITPAANDPAEVRRIAGLAEGLFPMREWGRKAEAAMRLFPASVVESALHEAAVASADKSFDWRYVVGIMRRLERDRASPGPAACPPPPPAPFGPPRKPETRQQAANRRWREKWERMDREDREAEEAERAARQADAAMGG